HRRRDQSVRVSEAAGLRAVGHSELAVDVRQVELHGLLCHEELTGETVVRRTRRDETQQLELALGEAEGLVRRARLRNGLTRANARIGHAVEDRAAHDLP